MSGDITFSVDDERLLQVLRDLVTVHGTQKSAVEHLGVSDVYVSDIPNGRRDIRALAPRLGFTSLTIHVPDGEVPPITAAEAARLIDGLRRRRIAAAQLEAGKEGGAA